MEPLNIVDKYAFAAVRGADAYYNPDDHLQWSFFAKIANSLNSR